jgi:hypothetical protein
MEKTRKLFIMGVIGAGILTVLLIGTDTALTTSTPNSNVGCLSLAEVKTIRADLPIPSYLPSGYTYKCGIADSGEAHVVFWNQTIDTSTYQVDPINAVQVSRGAIVISTIDEPITNATESALAEFKSVNGTDTRFTPQLMNINGKIAWGNDLAPSGGIATAKFPDGKVITKYFDVPARIRIFDSGKLTMIEGFVPLQEITKVAKSLQ